MSVAPQRSRGDVAVHGGPAGRVTPVPGPPRGGFGGDVAAKGGPPGSVLPGTGIDASSDRWRAIAEQFPVLRREVDGRRLVYLDSAATSQTPQVVIDAIVDYYTVHRASVHRGVYPLIVEATDLYEGARERIAAWLGSTVEETIFTANATAAINLVAYSWARDNLGPGDVVVLTRMEHHSNLVPWQLICADRGASIEYVPVLDDGHLDLDALDSLLAREPKL